MLVGKIIRKSGSGKSERKGISLPELLLILLDNREESKAGLSSSYGRMGLGVVNVEVRHNFLEKAWHPTHARVCCLTAMRLSTTPPPSMAKARRTTEMESFWFML